MSRIDDIYKYYTNENKRKSFKEKFDKILEEYPIHNDFNNNGIDLCLVDNCHIDIIDFNNAIDMLSEKQMVVIKERYLNQLSYEECSKKLDLNESTIRTHETRGLDNLFNNIMDIIIAKVE